jgi:uncharacterized protein YbjT (DUF2867 family)
MIVITGATGNTGKAVAEALLAKGEKVRVIGRDSKKLEPFVQKGAQVFVGDVEDAGAMSKALEGATAVYLVIPQAMNRDDFRAYQERVSDAYAAALKQNGVPHVVTLSSIGAQHAQGVGPVVGLHNMEVKLGQLPGIHVLNLRPGFFMENELMVIQPIRTMGVLPGGFTADLPLPMIATKDIGDYAAQRLHKRDFVGNTTQELLGPRDYTLKQVATILGQAIGKPELRYMQVPFLMLEPALIQMGIAKGSATMLIELWKATNQGQVKAQEARSPQNTTPTTLDSFATAVFAPTYLGKTASA